MTTEALPVGTPSAEGVDARGILAFMDVLEADPEVELHSLMLLRRGHVLAAGWWAPYSSERQHLLYSLSKSFASTALGLAVGEGLVSLDDPVIRYFPELDAKISDPGSRSMLVRHIAAMASGHLMETLDRARANDPLELVQGFLSIPPDRQPGSVFAYNQPCTYTVAAIVQRVSGQRLVDFLRPRLFDPLGIGPADWLQDPPTGRDIGFSGLHLTTDAIARLGQLYLQRGTWKGRQILSPDWVAQATSVQIANATVEGNPGISPDWEQGYGFQFWMSRHGYRGDGAYGQFCLVLPELEAVVAITAGANNMANVLDAAWAKLLPAFKAQSIVGAQEADAALADRLGRLVMGLPPAGKAAPSGEWSNASLQPAGGSCKDQPSLLGAQVIAAEGGWKIVLDEGDWQLSAPIGEGEWQVGGATSPAGGQVPIAVAGRFADPDTLELEILFLETPHRLSLTCSNQDHSFSAQWQTVPLHHPSLRDLAVPRHPLPFIEAR
jgi:CubicO group peptidase (beta-lactamase class C family)